MPPTRPVPSREEIVAKADDGTLLTAMFSEWGGYSFGKDDPTVIVLAETHNRGDVDLLAIVTPSAVAALNRHDFFRGQHLYCALIPRLEGSTEAMMRAVEALYRGAGQDGARGLIIEPFSQWCGANPSRPNDLINLINSGVESADDFLTIAIKSGASFDLVGFTNLAYGYLESGTETQKLGAINALGQVAIPDDAGWQQLMNAFTATLDPDPGDQVRSTILAAIGRRLKDAPPHTRPGLEAIALKACEPLGELTLHQGCQLLGFNFGDLAEGLVRALLVVALNVSANNKGTLDLLDYGLSNFVKAGRSAEARAFVEKLVLRDEDPVSLKSFDSLRHELFQVGGEPLEEWVVAWLRDGDYALCQQLDKALFGAGTDEHILNIDFAKYGIGEADYPYLARKTIATFFLKPKLMASILVSLLRTAPPSASREIEELIADPVLTNYSGVASEYLRPISTSSSDPAAEGVTRTLAALDQYIEGLKAIGIVPELHPSDRERQLEFERHSDGMNAAFREARKKSIFAAIATESVMLYGNRAVSWVAMPNEAPRRIQTDLASIGTSFEMPRVDTVDPLGLQLMLLAFRAERPAE